MLDRRDPAQITANRTQRPAMKVMVLTEVGRPLRAVGRDAPFRDLARRG
jgi:hypothetical protein